MKKRSGFTLMEVLTVIAIIGVLSALLYPVLNNMIKRTRDTASTDLCSQVAAAWKLVQIDNGRMPSDKLLKAYAETDTDMSSSDGDLVFNLTPKLGCILNWWDMVSPVAAADKREFDLVYSEHFSSGANVEFWPSDRRLERSVQQKKYGVFAPWADFYFNDPEVTETERRAAVKKALVRVVIDSDGDGMVAIPTDIAELTGLDTSGGEDDLTGRTLRAPAAAWVWDRDHKKVLHSW